MGILDALLAAADHAVAYALQGAANAAMDQIEQLQATQPGWPGGDDTK